jgi:hypothetical protein
MATRKTQPAPDGDAATQDVDPAAKAKSDAEAADSTAAEEVQAAVNAETEQGFRGLEVDPTPNENYTVAGQAAGAPTPETDPGAAEAARKAAVETSARASGVTEL